jgi:hypothetical protein
MVYQKKGNGPYGTSPSSDLAGFAPIFRTRTPGKLEMSEQPLSMGAVGKPSVLHQVSVAFSVAFPVFHSVLLFSLDK